MSPFTDPELSTPDIEPGISHEDLWNHIAIIEANVLAINAKLDRIMPLVDEAEKMLRMTPMQKIRAALK